MGGFPNDLTAIFGIRHFSSLAHHFPIARMVDRELEGHEVRRTALGQTLRIEIARSREEDPFIGSRGVFRILRIENLASIIEFYG